MCAAQWTHSAFRSCEVNCLMGDTCLKNDFSFKKTKKTKKKKSDVRPAKCNCVNGWADWWRLRICRALRNITEETRWQFRLYCSWDHLVEERLGITGLDIPSPGEEAWAHPLWGSLSLSPSAGTGHVLAQTLPEPARFLTEAVECKAVSELYFQNPRSWHICTVHSEPWNKLL